MSAIQIFQFDTATVRTLPQDGAEPLFVAKDVALALGYVDTDQAVRAHCKKARSVTEVLEDPSFSRGQKIQPLALELQTKLIPESDVYRLVMRSKLESAERFRDWVVEEVLPTLRKTGSFSLAVPNFDDPVAAARAWADAKERELLAERKALALAEQIETERPLTELAKALIGQETMIRRDWISMMKADSGLGSKLKEKEVNKWLVDAGYCYREGINNEMRAYSHSSHLFKLEPETLNGGVRLLLKLTGEGVRQLTPLVLAHFTGQQKK